MGRDLFWFAFGAFVGFDVAVGYAWHTIRRSRHGSGVADRVRPYVGQRRWPW